MAAPVTKKYATFFDKWADRALGGFLSCAFPPPMAIRPRPSLSGLLAWVLPFAVYALTTPPGPGLDDAAELGLVTAHWSVAHPPGFPLWTALAHLWQLAGSLDLLSAALGATASCLLFVANARLLAVLLPATSPATIRFAAFTAALGSAFGAVTWQWSNAVEVYALQGCATALVLYGLALDPRTHGRCGAVLIGLGAGIGLQNHSVSMLLFLPLAVLLQRATWGVTRFRLAAAVAAGIVVLGCGLLLWRGQGVYVFEFGNPDNLRRLWHHLSGGFYGEGVLREGADHRGRFGFLLGVIGAHFWLLAAPALLGLWLLARRHLALTLGLVGYLLALVLLQSSRATVANLDSYLIPALLALSLPLSLGCAHLLRGRWHFVVALLLVVASVALNWRACDRRGYGPGEAVLADLAASAPQRAVLVLSNWDQRMLAMLGQDQQGWRPDVLLVPSDGKGTNRQCLEAAQPDLVAALQPEYDAWLDTVAAIDPDYVFTDWYQVTSKEQHEAYQAFARKLLNVARAQGRPVVVDRATLAFWLKGEVVTAGWAHPSGMLFAIGEPTPEPLPFPVTGDWLEHPFLPGDLCAAAVLRDYQQVARQMLGYWKFRGDRARQAALETQVRRIDAAAARFRTGKGFLGWKD